VYDQLEMADIFSRYQSPSCNVTVKSWDKDMIFNLLPLNGIKLLQIMWFWRTER